MSELFELWGRAVAVLVEEAMRLLGEPVHVGDYQRQGWSGALPHYSVRSCKRHGTYVTYPQGYGRVLMCEECLKEIAESESTQEAERSHFTGEAK